MRKKIKEEDRNISTDLDTYNSNTSQIDSKLGQTGELTITDDLDEGLKLPKSDIIDALGITFGDKTPEEKNQILKFVSNMMTQLRDQFGVGAIMAEDEDPEIGSLYSGADNDAIEYGVQNEDEKFDKMLETLKPNKSIDITENVNPRIKKKDLIKYYKNKK